MPVRWICCQLFMMSKATTFLHLSIATEAAELFHKYGDELREADALVKIGDGYDVQNDYQSAIQYYNQAIELYQKHNDQTLGELYHPETGFDLFGFGKNPKG
jgi:tetratricopeptide (TPR) repeat protein